MPRPILDRKSSAGFLFTSLDLAALVLFLSLFACLPGNAAYGAKQILILHSYNQGFPWTDDVMRGMLTVFDSSGIDPNLHIEYMDTKRHIEEESFPYLDAYFEAKFKDISFDAILVSDNSALEYALSRRYAFFRGAPIVFCGINDFQDVMLQGQANITGVVEAIDVKGTIALAKRLMPGLKRLVAINDRTKTGLANTQLFREAEASGETDIELELWDDVTVDDLREKLAALPDDTGLLVFTFHQDKLGRKFSMEEYLDLIGKSCDRPLFAFWAHYLGRGVVGGSMIYGVAQGETAANMALRILAGESADAIPIMRKSPNVPLLDYSQLVRFHVSQDDISPDDIIINKPGSFYQTYKTMIWTASVAFVVQFLVILALFLVIAARRRVEKALRASEKRFRGIFESSPLALWEVDMGAVKRILGTLQVKGADDLKRHFAEHPDAARACVQAVKIVDVNGACVKLHGARSKTELIDGYLDIFTDAARLDFAKAMAEIASDGPSCYFETTVRALPGELLFIMVYIEAIDGYEESLEKTLVTFVDVTEKKRLEETIVQTEKMMSVGGLAAGMAHEINNPLGVILAGAQNIRRRLDPDFEINREAANECRVNLTDVQRYFEQRGILRFLSGIQSAASRAGVIVKNMLDFSRRSESVKCFRSLPALLDKVLEIAGADYSLTDEFDFKRIEIRREYDPALPPVPVIEAELEQAVLNLLKNAGNAMAAKRYEQGGPCIIVRAYPSRDWAVIEIEDNGPGMDEATRKRVFEPFFTTKGPSGGTGLGLSVAYFIITQNHGGEFSVNAEPGLGATFTIRLPIETPAVPEPENESPACNRLE